MQTQTQTQTRCVYTLNFEYYSSTTQFFLARFLDQYNNVNYFKVGFVEQRKEGQNLFRTTRFITQDLDSYRVDILIVRGT